MKFIRLLFYLSGVTAVLISGQTTAQQPKLVINGLQFVDHITAGMPEQDAYVEKTPGSGEVFRLTSDELEAFKTAPVYGTAEPVHHSPFNPAANGPYPRGKALEMSLEQWLAGRGTGTYVCKDGQAELKVAFEKLVPNSVYTMWYAFAGKAHMGCPGCHFSTIDFPVGNMDGSQSVFKTDAQGNANYVAVFEPCLRLGSERLAAMLAIAYHSDGKTYGPDPGKFGTVSHVQLFSALPDQGAWTKKPETKSE